MDAGRKNLMRFSYSTGSIWFFALLFTLAGLGGCSEVVSPTKEVEEDRQGAKADIEEYLDWRFENCRGAHFEIIEQGFGENDITLMYFELPEEELRGLLDNHTKLADYDKLKENHVNAKCMKEDGSGFAWWDADRLDGSLTATESWCAVYRDGECFLTAYSTVSIVHLNDGWQGVYISFGSEAFSAGF